MAFWNPQMTAQATAIPVNVPRPENPPRMLTQEERDKMLSEERAPHSGVLRMDVRILLILGLMVVVVLVLLIFFRNAAKVRGQLRAQNTAAVLAQTMTQQTKAILREHPLPAASPSAEVGGGKDKKRGKGEDSAEADVTSPSPRIELPQTHPVALYFRSIDALQTLKAAEDQPHTQVMGAQGWVYADSKTAPSSDTNLMDVFTTDKTSVGKVVRDQAKRGGGFISYTLAIPTHNSAVTQNTVFVRAVPESPFIFIVKAGSFL